MKRVLIIEDDPLIADTYRNEIADAGFIVDLAVTGESAIEMFKDKRPDLVLLDLMLPGINGLDVLETIRSTADIRELPVFVFTNAYLGGMVQQAWEFGANLVLTKISHTPKQVVQLIKSALEEPQLTDLKANGPIALQERHPGQMAWFQTKLLQTAAHTRSALKQSLRLLATHPTNHANVLELYAKAHPLASLATFAGLEPLAQMAEAFEGFLKELIDKRAPITPSVLLTIAQALETLDFLVEHHEAVALSRPSLSRIMIVDDDPFACQAVCRALNRVNLQAICVDSPELALQQLGDDHFDLIFLDIEMPEVDGFELCSILRATPAYQAIPIVFLSLYADHAHRAESMQRGGDDFISKPFLYMELAVKALSLVMRAPLKNVGRIKRFAGRNPQSHGKTHVAATSLPIPVGGNGNGRHQTKEINP